MQPFHYTRPRIGLDITVTAAQHNGLWELEAVGECGGQSIEYSEMWFQSSEEVRRNIENNADSFYLALLSADKMQELEVSSFEGLPEFQSGE